MESEAKIIQFFLNLAMEVKKAVGHDIFFWGGSRAPFFRAFFFFFQNSQKCTCNWNSIPKPKKIYILALAAEIFCGPVVRAALLAQMLN